MEMLKNGATTVLDHFAGNPSCRFMGAGAAIQAMRDLGLVRFDEPFTTTSSLGGTLGVSEAVIGLGAQGYFVGPSFTRHGEAWVEHLQCEYLAALELACSAEPRPICRRATATRARSSSATRRAASSCRRRTSRLHAADDRPPLSRYQRALVDRAPSPLVA